MGIGRPHRRPAQLSETAREGRRDRCARADELRHPEAAQPVLTAGTANLFGRQAWSVKAQLALRLRQTIRIVKKLVSHGDKAASIL
jgi:hypothetical protein